jgi:hypothetical protein
MSAQPPIVSRASWGAATRVAGNRGVSPSQRRRFVVHWPVMSSRDERQWCRDIERMHASSISSEAAPAYNFLCGQSGTLFEGCGRDVRGPANGNNNANIDGWSCCVFQPSTAGGTPTAPLSQAARNSVRALYEWLCTVSGRRLTMQGHRDVTSTACPGPDLYAWVRAGMPATGGVAPEQPPTIDEVEMITTCLADSGVFNVFVVGPARGTIWDTWQRPNENSWNGGAPGKSIAGLRRFCEAPQGRTIRGVAAERAANGNLHVFATLDDGSTWYTWQGKGQTGWSGGQQGRVAALSPFAPRP